MKKTHILDCEHYYDFIVLAINSHIKVYQLCWTLNQNMGLNFEIINNHKINDRLSFTRYKSENDAGIFNLLVNRSKKGYMIPSKKSVNYFLITKKQGWSVNKYKFLDKLREINDILLVFEFKLEEEKYSDRFIIHDKKN
tara:strand:+ start:265 stop:681 length:417 start_codon:yes stop_codon:yes gene_type:complete